MVLIFTPPLPLKHQHHEVMFKVRLLHTCIGLSVSLSLSIYIYAHVRIFVISCGAVCFGLKLGGSKLSVELSKPFDGLICRLTGNIMRK